MSDRDPLEFVTEDDGQYALALPSDFAERERLPETLVSPPIHEDAEQPPPIRRVWFKNFKGYRELEADLGRFNVLAGANNAGKSTLLQGVDLLFSLMKLHAEGDHLGAGRLVPSSILPVASLRDLFYEGRWRVGNEYVSATLGAAFADSSEVEFGVRLMFGSGNSRLLRHTGMTGTRLNSLLGRPAVWVPSAVGIVRDEEYRTAARRAALIGAGRHNEVLRNLLIVLREERPNDYTILQRILMERFSGHLGSVSFNGDLDQFVNAAYEDRSGVRHDLYSAGAGFIQVVQLLAFVLTREASVVLLDEPDAHLHSSLQRVVVEILDEIAEQKNLQVVLATHSKEIINFVDPSRLILIEAGATRAEPVSTDVTPMSILQSLGSVDNVDAYALVRNRRCLFVEGTTDAAILGRFAATLGIRALTGDDRVVTVPTSGADKFEHVQQLDVFEAVLGGQLKSLEIRDRDGRLDGQRQALQAKAKRPLHVLTRDCIESYLIVPVALARAVNEILEERGREQRVDPDEMEVLILEMSEAMKDATVDRVATRYLTDEFSAGNRTLTPATVNPLAREAVNNTWPELARRLHFVAGKQLLGSLRQEIQTRYGVNFGNERLAGTFVQEEIDGELVDLLRRVADLQAS